MVFEELLINGFWNYLSNRKQYVQISNVKSNTEDIAYGVPQGSILGPLLYLVYVNDISKSSNGHILFFADDTSLLISEENITILFERANAEMQNVYE